MVATTAKEDGRWAVVFGGVTGVGGDRPFGTFAGRGVVGSVISQGAVWGIPGLGFGEGAIALGHHKIGFGDAAIDEVFDEVADIVGFDEDFAVGEA